MLTKSEKHVKVIIAFARKPCLLAKNSSFMYHEFNGAKRYEEKLFRRLANKHSYAILGELLMKFLLFLLLFFSVFCMCSCSSPKAENTDKEAYEDYSNPAKTLETFFRAGHSGSVDVVARCYLDWDNVIARSEGYKTFIEHIRMETQDTDYTIFKVGRKDNLLELGIEITSEKPYFRRRDFYYFDYYKGKWLIVTSGWMKNLGCG